MISKQLETWKDFEDFCKEISNEELIKWYRDISKLCETEEKIWEFKFEIFWDDNRKNIFSLYRGLYFENIKCVQYRISTDESRFFEWFTQNKGISNWWQNFRFIKLSDAFLKLKERLISKRFKDKISEKVLRENNLCLNCYSSKIPALRYFNSFYNPYLNYLTEDLKKEWMCSKGCDEKRIVEKVKLIIKEEELKREKMQEKIELEKNKLNKIKETIPFKEYNNEFWNWIHQLKSLSWDWEGIYLNGRLKAEGHSISKEDYYDLLKNINDIKLRTEDIGEEELFDSGNCPEKVNLVVKNNSKIFIYKD